VSVDIVLVSFAALTGYLIVAGAVYAWLPFERTDAGVACAFWPFVMAFMLGGSLVWAIRGNLARRRQAKAMPKAKIT
jgi:zinc transporter ZupT